MFKIGTQDIIGSIFTIGKMVFGGGDDDAESRQVADKRSSEKDKKGFILNKYSREAAERSKEAGKKVDYKNIKKVQRQQTVSAMNMVQPLIKRGMMTKESQSKLANRYKLDNFAYLQQYSSDQQFSALRNLAKKFEVDEDTSVKV